MDLLLLHSLFKPACLLPHCLLHSASCSLLPNVPVAWLSVCDLTDIIYTLRNTFNSHQGAQGILLLLLLLCVFTICLQVWSSQMTIEYLAGLTFHHSSINCPVELAAGWWLFSHLEALLHTDFTDVFFHFAQSKSLSIKCIYFFFFYEAACLSAFKSQESK